MFSLRSLFGFTLSVLVHGSVGAYLLTHNYKVEKPKPKTIAMQMAMFKIAPPPLAVTKPVLMAPPEKSIEKIAEPKPVLVVSPPKQAIKHPVKELVKIEKPKPVIKEKVAVIKPKPKPPAKVKPKFKKKIKTKVKLKKKKKIKTKVKRKKKKKILKRKTVVVKKKPKIKPRKIAPPKHKAIVKKHINKKPQLARKAKASRHRPSPRKAALKRVVRHTTNTQQRAPIKKHGRPKTKQVNKPTHASKPAVRRKPAARPPTQPKIARNPHLERQYEQSIRQRIEQKKLYPRLAKRMRKQGVVRIAFTINRNGSFSKLRIVQSSGVKSLDKAALQAVKKVGRFPAIPAGIRKSVLSYIIPISYRLR